MKLRIAVAVVITACAIAGCSAKSVGSSGISQASTSPPASATASPSAPAPVSSTAALTGNCVMGYEPSQGRTYGPFTKGIAPNGPPGGAEPVLAYQLTLTDDGTTTAGVSGFAVVFYDTSGSEDGSDKQATADTFIVPGQALSWIVVASAALNGNWTGDLGRIPDSAATCQLVQWYRAS